MDERPNFDAFYCMLKSERELKSLWDDYCNSWLTENVPNGSIERFHQECIVSKVYKENPSYLGPFNVNGDRMSNLDREKKDELFYAVSRSSETPQVLDIEEPRLRLMPMEGRCPKSQYICSNVRLGESNDAVPRKGLFERGDKESKKMIFL